MGWPISMHSRLNRDYRLTKYLKFTHYNIDVSSCLQLYIYGSSSNSEVINAEDVFGKLGGISFFILQTFTDFDLCYFVQFITTLVFEVSKTTHST